MSKKIIVANWKMHLNPAEASVLLHRLDERIEASREVEVVLCPPFIDLYPVAKELDKKKFSLGSQNIHYLDSGPFTGEISPQMLTGLVDYSIIGHSERRLNFGEDDKLIGKKVAAAIRHNIRPILCVGDTLDDKTHGHSKKVVNDQLTAGLSQITASEVGDLVVTYEPVWAISKGDGRGDFAKPDEVKPAVSAIRQAIKEMFGESAGASVQVLYGGSVNPDNAKAYLDLEGIDGLLVGGASLNYEEFSKIVASAK